MKKISEIIKGKYLHILAVLLFFAITVVYFKPLLFNKILFQQDIVSGKNMTHEINEFRKTENAEPLWTNSMFSGMPTYQLSTVFPGNLIKFIDKVFTLSLPHPSGTIFVSFLCFFILLLCLEVKVPLAFFGAIAYGFSSYLYISLAAGHNSKVAALAYLPAIIGGVYLLLNNKRKTGFLLTMIFMALEFHANHLQITYYGFMFIGVIFILYLIRAVKEKKQDVLRMHYYFFLQEQASRFCQMQETF